MTPDGIKIVRNVTVPTLTPILPAPGTATGAAVIVAPGGGFVTLAIDHEGYAVAHWLAAHGIAAFVLKYRLESTPAILASSLLRQPKWVGGCCPEVRSPLMAAPTQWPMRWLPSPTYEQTRLD